MSLLLCDFGGFIAILVVDWIGEPAADLAVVMAVISSFKNKPADSKTVAFGEVGLLGEVRKSVADERRIKEARKLGFTNILSRSSATSIKDAASYLG